jgi:oligopeptide transport system substrate-binding protein
MFRTRIWVLVSVLLLAGLVLPACTSAPVPTPQVVEKIVTSVVEKEKQVNVVQTTVVEKPKTVLATATPAPKATGPKTLRLAWGPGDIPTIDPALAEDQISVQQIEETTVGLLRQDETTGLLGPGLATKWEVSEDGKVYTFHLRDDVPWVKYDGKQVVKVPGCPDKDNKTADRMVTADDFAYGILRSLNPDTASPYAYVLNFAIAGADEYNQGKITDTKKVGVEAVDPKTLKITVKDPAIYNLNILSLWPAHAQPKWLIEGDDCTEARGGRWVETGFFQGYGPYTLKEWVHDANLTLVKNPFWPGAENIPVAKIDEVDYRILDSSAAFAEFEAGNMDVTAVPEGDRERVRADPKYQPMLETDTSGGTEFYSFNTKLAPTDDVRVRQALSLAIDRKALTEQVNQGAGVPAQWFCQPGMAACPTMDKYPDLGVKYDPEKAKQLLDEYLKEKGTTADKLQLMLMFNTSEANKKRAEAIQNMWKTVLGLDVQMTNQETKVYYAQRKQGKENIYRSSWVQDYPDANNFDKEVFGQGGAYSEVVKWQSDQYDALMAQASNETDSAKRMDLYAQAEKILINDDAVIAPLYYYSTPYLFQPNIKHPVSKTGYWYYEKWDNTK